MLLLDCLDMLDLSQMLDIDNLLQELLVRRCVRVGV
jgi:hypothetical protein